MGFDEKPDPFMQRRQLEEVIGPLREWTDRSSTTLGCVVVVTLPIFWAAVCLGLGFGFWSGGGISLAPWVVLVAAAISVQGRMRRRAVQLAVRAFDGRFPPESPEYRDAMQALLDASKTEKDSDAREALAELHRALGGEPPTASDRS